MDQFVKGQFKNGKQLDCGVGFSETYMRCTIRSLEEKQLIEVDRRNTKAHLFRLTINRGSLACAPQPIEISRSGVH
jgi:hypothetical protein